MARPGDGGGGEVRGVTLAGNREEAEAATASLRALREALETSPPSGGRVAEATLAAARAAAVPDALTALLDGAQSVIAVTDGPLAGIPIELLLPGIQVVYTPSATIALRPRVSQTGATTLAALGGVVVGDPVFSRGGPESDDLEAPHTGILLAMVAEGSNAEQAGLRRGDVLLAYGEHSLASPADLAPAIGATAEALTTRGVTDERPVIARVWRDGEEIEVTLALGRMGVQSDQRPPADALRSMRFMEQPADRMAADAAALEQVRFYGTELSPLPATRLEASAVAAMLGDDAILLLGEEATAPAVRRAVETSTPRVIHMATHGLLGNDRDPLLASLALNTPKEPTPDDIGFLTLGDILEHWGGQLRGVELVTLSACDTGRGVQQGDTSMALPLGLLVGGADSVLASLWKVHDRATSLLMARFYANWLGKTQGTREIDGATCDPGTPMPKLAALREAQAWLRTLTADDLDRLRDASGQTIAQSVSLGPELRPGTFVAAAPSHRPYEHPYFWAAFVLYGDPE